MINRPMETDELVTLVSDTDQVLGQMEKHLAHRLNKKHRAFSVILFDTEGRMILQRRAATKYHSPNLWTNACCGHPRPGEATLDAAHRRLGEEMGIDTPLQHLFTVSYQYAVSKDMWENEFDHIFIGSYASHEFELNPEEISEIQTLSLPFLERDIIENPDRYTVWFKLILPKLMAHLAKTKTS